MKIRPIRSPDLASQPVAALTLPPRFVAIHESAHAVISLRTGPAYMTHPFHRVFIRTKEECDAGPYVDDRGQECDVVGMVEGPRHFPAYTAAHADRDWLEQMRDLMEWEAISELAGPIAEARHRRVPLWRALMFGGDGDIEMAREAVGCYATGAEAGAYLERMRRQASKAVGQHWQDIRCVADALMERRTLDCDEVRELMGLGPA